MQRAFPLYLVLLAALALAFTLGESASFASRLSQESPLQPTAMPSPFPSPTPAATPTWTPLPPTPTPRPTATPTWTPRPSPPTPPPSPSIQLSPSPLAPAAPEPATATLAAPPSYPAGPTPSPTDAAGPGSVPPLYIPPREAAHPGPTEVATPWPTPIPRLSGSIIWHQYLPYTPLDWAALYPFLRSRPIPTPRPSSAYLWARRIERATQALWQIVPGFFCMGVAALLLLLRLLAHTGPPRTAHSPVSRRRRGVS